MEKCAEADLEPLRIETVKQMSTRVVNGKHHFFQFPARASGTIRGMWLTSLCPFAAYTVSGFQMNTVLPLCKSAAKPSYQSGVGMPFLHLLCAQSPFSLNSCRLRCTYQVPPIVCDSGKSTSWHSPTINFSKLTIWEWTKQFFGEKLVPNRKI